MTVVGEARRSLRVGAMVAVGGLLWALGCGTASAPPQAPLAAPSSPAASSTAPRPQPSAAAPEAPSSAPPAAKAPGDLPGYRIDPAALVGCRAPDEPGCASCCLKSGNDCSRLWSPEDWSQPGMGEAWYNASSVGCPAQCAACASCTKRQELELAALLPFTCDCDKTQIGIDPCFDPPSCACQCSRRQYLTKACPKAP